MKLGVLLREYDIRSANIRFPDGTRPRATTATDFADAWNRYCPRTRNRRPTRPKPSRTGPEGEAVPAVPASTAGQRGTASPVGRLKPSQQNKPSQPDQHK